MTQGTKAVYDIRVPQAGGEDRFIMAYPFEYHDHIPQITAAAKSFRLRALAKLDEVVM